MAKYNTDKSGSIHGGINIHFKIIMCEDLRLIKNGQKSDSVATHFDHHFNTTMSCTYLRKYIRSK